MSSAAVKFRLLSSVSIKRGSPNSSFVEFAVGKQNETVAWI